MSSEHPAYAKLDGLEYLQSAGTADGMTIELRRLEDDGQYHQYAIGKRGSEGQSLDREVKYDEYVLHVRPGEVFTADEATPIYYAYFQGRTIPDDLVLRELDLTKASGAEGPSSTETGSARG